MVRTSTTMATDTDPRSLVRLLTWLSPAFPVGGFAYSGGLEAAVRNGRVNNAGELGDWLRTLLRHGGPWNDAVLLADAWRTAGDPPRLAELVDLALALAGSLERHQETVRQGEAFLLAAAAWPSPVMAHLPPETPYPVAVGAVAAGNGVSLADSLVAFLHGLLAQQISAAIRLGILGQTQAVSLQADLEADLIAAATDAATSTLDDLGSAVMLADLMSMAHETQYSRLFRS